MPAMAMAKFRPQTAALLNVHFEFPRGRDITFTNFFLAFKSALSPNVVGSMAGPQLVIDAVAHCFDHYGQLVEYLRMNGIVPPASRPKEAR
jgi:hypothetical protein